MATSAIAPCLLVAAPGLDCPFFRRSVVLLVEHGDQGSLGFVVNRPSALGFDDVASQLSLPMADASRVAPVLVGGPVQPDSGWLLLEGPPTEALDDDAVVTLPNGLSLSASLAALETVARGEGPERTVLFLGYAGWGPGQLGDEFREGAWIPADVDPRLLFELPLEERWAAALASLGIDPARVVTTGGSAQA